MGCNALCPPQGTTGWLSHSATQPLLGISSFRLWCRTTSRLPRFPAVPRPAAIGFASRCSTLLIGNLRHAPAHPAAPTRAGRRELPPLTAKFCQCFPSRRCSPPGHTHSRHYKYVFRSSQFQPFFPFFFILTLKPKRELINPCLEGRRPALHSAEPTGLDYPSGSSVSEFLLPKISIRDPKTPFSL